MVEQAPISLDPDVILEQVDEIASVGATITDADEVLGTGMFQNAHADTPPLTRSLADYLERLHWFAEDVMPRVGS